MDTFLCLRQIPKDDKWQSLLSSLDMFTDDFLAEKIPNLEIKEREAIERKHTRNYILQDCF